jgi:hypothetical protein
MLSYRRTIIERSAAIPFPQKIEIPPTDGPENLEDDPRWRLTQRIVAGRHFARSPLLSKFLLFIVAETLQGRQARITEQKIGVQVFSRPQGYRTIEDNIVRNYARQLRKRLAEQLVEEPGNDSMRVEIPLGRYVPVFIDAETRSLSQPSLVVPTPALVDPGGSGPFTPTTKPSASRARSRAYRILIAIGMFTGYSAVLIYLTVLAFSHIPAIGHSPEPPNLLLTSIFDPSRNTYIVPPDAGLNLMEDMSHHPIPLAQYIKSGYLDLPLPPMDAHSATDMRTQEFTNFSNLQIVAGLATLPEYKPQRVFLRFPRDLRFDDLKNANAVILGSVCSNPWAAVADESTNFHIHCGDGMQGAAIVNNKPQPGEQASYLSQWDEPTHETYALIIFVPNLGGNGHLLLLEGLDVAGTQAAAEVLLHSDALARILERAHRPHASLASFEVLLRATSIESNAAGTQVMAFRIHGSVGN